MARWRGRFQATEAAAFILRNEMAAIARECGLDDEGVDDVKLAVSEAVANVVLHAYRDREIGDVTATAHLEDGALRIVIADTGIGMRPRPDSPGLGLGLPLIAQLAESVEVNSDTEGTELQMTFPCPATTRS